MKCKNCILPDGLPTCSLSNGNLGHWDIDKIYLPRKQRDWTKDNHVYGVDVKREEYLKSGDGLKLLMANPHPALANVVAFCDCTVVCERMKGVVLDASSRFSPKQWTIENDGVATLPKSFVALAFYYVADALEHLHKIGLAHTDPTGNNVMHDPEHNSWRLVDLMSCVPATPEMIQLDNYVFEHYLLAPIAKRLGGKDDKRTDNNVQQA